MQLRKGQEAVAMIGAHASIRSQNVLWFLGSSGLIATLLVLPASSATASRETSAPGSIVASSASGIAKVDYGKLPLSFEVNSGQANRRVKFLARGSGYNL